MDRWDEGGRYDDYMGRWSRVMADEFLRWLAIPPGFGWLDVGCGTGALTGAILESSRPTRVTGVDPSPAFIEAAGSKLGAQASLRVGDAQHLEFNDATFDAVVSGLALNFVPDPIAALEEFRRVAKDQATVAVYVWDYAHGMQMIRHFWDVAIALDPSISDLDEAVRFPICDPTELRATFAAAGLRDIVTTGLEIPTVFRSFSELWAPFLGGQGPIPSYVMSLPAVDRSTLRSALEEKVGNADAPIHLTARAWAIKAVS